MADPDIRDLAAGVALGQAANDPDIDLAFRYLRERRGFRVELCCLVEKIQVCFAERTGRARDA